MPCLSSLALGWHPLGFRCPQRHLREDPLVFPSSRALDLLVPVRVFMVGLSERRCVVDTNAALPRFYLTIVSICLFNLQVWRGCLYRGFLSMATTVGAINVQQAVTLRLKMMVVSVAFLLRLGRAPRIDANAYGFRAGLVRRYTDRASQVTAVIETSVFVLF